MDLWILSRLVVRLHICKCNVCCYFKYCKCVYKNTFHCFLRINEPPNFNGNACAFFGSGNNFNKMHLWQNLGAGQNGKTQEVWPQVVAIHMMSRCHVNWFSLT